jgi:hypothetical protein
MTWTGTRATTLSWAVTLSIDGAAGLREDLSNLPDEATTAAWKQRYNKLESIAQSAR